jgi:hypothetical protein
MTFFISKLAGCRRRPQRVKTQAGPTMPKRKKEGKSKPMDETKAGSIYSSDFQKRVRESSFSSAERAATAAEQA